METDSARPLVTVSFPRQALPVAADHKDLIVIWPFVPWAEWPLTSTGPAREEDEISRQHPLASLPLSD